MSDSLFLSGDHVSLFTIEEDDLPFLRALLDHPQVRRTILEHKPRTLAQRRDWWTSLDGDVEVHLLIYPTEEDDAVGTASIVASIRSRVSAVSGSPYGRTSGERDTRQRRLNSLSSMDLPNEGSKSHGHRWIHPTRHRFAFWKKWDSFG